MTAKAAITTVLKNVTNVMSLLLLFWLFVCSFWFLFCLLVIETFVVPVAVVTIFCCYSFLCFLFLFLVVIQNTKEKNVQRQLQATSVLLPCPVFSFCCSALASP
eukprot:m.179417 g.179417  ORF g.179417 m.179417 type:complete len:104 (+) comp25389_c0_seq3:161-472(+)